MLKARVHFPMRAISDNGSSLAERNNQLIVNWSKALVPFTTFYYSSTGLVSKRMVVLPTKYSRALESSLIGLIAIKYSEFSQRVACMQTCIRQ